MSRTETLGLYIHIPFCLQRCRYCDFATYSQDEIPVNDAYIHALLKELRTRRNLYQQNTLKTIYFGGGTPSLLSPHQFATILSEVRSLFEFAGEIEITVEVNPATLTHEKCEQWAQLGINRVSVGAQTFSDSLLKACGRKHNAQQTVDTLSLVQKYFPNYSLDVLFALPGQDLRGLEVDLEMVAKFNPPHVSTYCLTLAEGHPMNTGRAPEDEQVEMFSLVRESLNAQGLTAYEISNFAKPGHESRHNLLYWQDQNYWGVGLSSHSYRRDHRGEYRFWNPSSYKAYMEMVENLESYPELEQSFPAKFYEKLQPWESLTDYVHTQLRLDSGVSRAQFLKKFSQSALTQLSNKLHRSTQFGLVQPSSTGWKLTPQGQLLSNQVFADILFSAEDIDKLSSDTILSNIRGEK